MPSPTLKAWRVDGVRDLGAGASVTILASSFGSTEQAARAWFHRRINLPTYSPHPEREPWRDSELTFTEETP